jgi:putative CocE/NonD family hydrolase
VEFFAHYLKGEAPPLEWPRAKVYITGINRWREYYEYPPEAAEETSFYLASGGSANTMEGDGTLEWSTPGRQPTDGYTFDPKEPVPSSIAGEALGIDRRPIQRREDVLVYTSDVLEDTVEITGSVLVELYAATDARDTDFTAVLTDVYPDGRAVALGIGPEGIIRARYRNGLDHTELVTPGSVEKYTIDLAHIGHAFLPGHRIRLEISSSSYPAYNPNQNTGNPVATDTEWRKALQTIHHDRAYPSRLILPVVPNPPEDSEGGGDS